MPRIKAKDPTAVRLAYRLFHKLEEMQAQEATVPQETLYAQLWDGVIDILNQEVDEDLVEGLRSVTIGQPGKGA